MDRREALTVLGLGTLALESGILGAGAQSPAPAALEGYQNGEFVLPPLPYEYGALEPHIDAQTVKLHHDMHHAAYVKGANKAMAALRELCEGKRDSAEIKRWEGELAFHGSGHALHAMYWRNMSPKPGAPSKTLQEAIDRDFGGSDKMKAVLAAAANAVEGSGWAILGCHPMTGGLLAVQAEKHQNLAFQGLVPLLALDVWEHAYYLKYQNRRADYIEAFWNVADWADVSRRYEAAAR